jgi:hypothetical protein
MLINKCSLGIYCPWFRDSSWFRHSIPLIAQPTLDLGFRYSFGLKDTHAHNGQAQTQFFCPASYVYCQQPVSYHQAPRTTHMYSTKQIPILILAILSATGDASVPACNLVGTQCVDADDATAAVQNLKQSVCCDWTTYVICDPNSGKISFQNCSQIPITEYVWACGETLTTAYCYIDGPDYSVASSSEQPNYSYGYLVSSEGNATTPDDTTSPDYSSTSDLTSSDIIGNTQSDVSPSTSIDPHSVPSSTAYPSEPTSYFADDEEPELNLIATSASIPAPSVVNDAEYDSNSTGYPRSADPIPTSDLNNIQPAPSPDPNDTPSDLTIESTTTYDSAPTNTGDPGTADPSTDSGNSDPSTTSRFRKREGNMVGFRKQKYNGRVNQV